jgi:hypothetical protein
MLDGRFVTFLVSAAMWGALLVAMKRFASRRCVFLPRFIIPTDGVAVSFLGYKSRSSLINLARIERASHSDDGNTIGT